MKIAVAGLWHLGSVTAACLASSGHSVTGLDPDSSITEELSHGRAPVAEPGLDALIAQQMASGRLRFSDRYEDARAHDVLWITFDTPVDANDQADVNYVLGQADNLLRYLSPGTHVLISSQVPVGTTRKLELSHAGRGLTFSYSPENLRLGKAIETFMKPDRIVAGVRSDTAKPYLAELFAPITDRVEWMGVESAEMAKHALNAFLATSVSFINEIAVLCESVAADASEVERALKTEIRIGPRAYLKPGAAFAGGTLARDVRFLQGIAGQHGRSVPLLDGVLASNDYHKGWLRRVLSEAVGKLSGKRIALLGLTYKPGTSTLRRSASVEASHWMHAEGAIVAAWDPAIRELPEELRSTITLCGAAEEALGGAEALVVATEWPEFLTLSADTVANLMRYPLVIDASRYLVKTLGSDTRIQYRAIGLSKHVEG